MAANSVISILRLFAILSAFFGVAGAGLILYQDTNPISTFLAMTWLAFGLLAWAVLRGFALICEIAVDIRNKLIPPNRVLVTSSRVRRVPRNLPQSQSEGPN